MFDLAKLMISQSETLVSAALFQGTHRLKLGDHRLYVESRLYSSIHVGDAAVAASIRDFPVTVAIDKEAAFDFSSASVLSRLGLQSAFENGGAVMPETGIGFPALLANASSGTLFHFQLLLVSPVLRLG